MSEVLYRKYRPMMFADVTDQEHVKLTLQNQLRTGHTSHAYVFTGPRGVGKTTLARLLAKAVNCPSVKDGEPCNACQSCAEITGGNALDVFEIDAASHTDVDNVRENIVKSVRFAPTQLKYKVYIIDEVHMLSTSSFNALLKTLEEPPSHALFILATTDIHKVPPTILSRCQRFDFRRIPASSMVARLKRIAESEGRSVEEAVLYEIAKHAEGSARDAEGLLGQIFAVADGPITMAEASLVLPTTTLVLVVNFVEALLKRHTEASVRMLNAYVEQGVDMPHFVDEVIELLRSLLIAKIGGAERMADVGDAEARARLSAALQGVDVVFLSGGIRSFLEAKRAGKTDRIPQLGAELAAVEICLSSTSPHPSLAGGETRVPLPRGTTGGLPSNAPFPLTASSSPVILRPTCLTEPWRSGEAEESPAPSDERSLPERQGSSGRAGFAHAQDDKKMNAEKVAPTSYQLPATSFGVKEVVFNSVPVIGLEEVKAKWPEVFQQIKENNAALPIIMQAGEISSVDGDLMEFAFQYSLHADTVNQDKNRRLIEGLFEKVLGKKVRVRAKYVHAESDAAVSDLLEQFGGQAAT